MKQKLNIFIVDSDSNVKTALLEELKKNISFEIIGTACNGDEALRRLKGKHINILILDLILPNKDGISVIKKFKTNDICIDHIIVTSAFLNNFIIKQLQLLNIDYLLQKPYDITELINTMEALFDTKCGSTYNIAQYRKLSPIELENKISKILHDIGMPAHLKGYHYIKQAILETYFYHTQLKWLASELYLHIANSNGTTPSRVERAIRHAIEVAWNRGNLNIINDLFSYSVSYLKTKPTNSEFIAMITEKLNFISSFE